MNKNMDQKEQEYARYQWDFNVKALKGTTRTSACYPIGPCSSRLLLVTRSCAEEIRICLVPYRGDGQETRKHNDVLCFAIGQNQKKDAALGFGNPHVKTAEAGYRHCHLSNENECNFWILCDHETGWVALGTGSQPTIQSALLTSRFQGQLQSRLSELTGITATNWERPVSLTVTVTTESVDVLHCASSKFDREGQTRLYYGLTTVCQLPSTHPLHLIMSHVREALAADPVLRLNYGLLPPSSFHMTTFDIVSGPNFEQAVHAFSSSQEAATATTALARVNSATFDQVPPEARLYTAALAGRLEQAGVLSSVPWTSFAMRAVSITAARTIELEPWNEDVAVALERWRSTVAAQSAALGGNGDGPIVRSVQQWKASRPRRGYRFHMTIAYVLVPLSKSVEALEAQQQLMGRIQPMLDNLGPVIVQAPHFCHFSSMSAFHPITLSPT